METGSLNAALTSKVDFFKYFQDADVFERRKIVDELKELVYIYNRSLKKLLIKTCIMVALYIFFLVNSHFLFIGTLLVMAGTIFALVITGKCLKNSLIYKGLENKCNRIWFDNEQP